MKHSPETIEKLRQASTGRTPWNKGKKMPESTKAKLRHLNKTGVIGRRGPHTDAAKSKMSARLSKILITYKGKTQNLLDWEKETGIYRMTIKARLARGWSVKDALTKPVREMSSNRNV